MDSRPGSTGKLERGGRLGTSVWVWYLTAGAVLAVTRVGLLVWLNHRLASHAATETDYFPTWLYPEGVVSIFWNSLVAFSTDEGLLGLGIACDGRQLRSRDADTPRGLAETEAHDARCTTRPVRRTARM